MGMYVLVKKLHEIVTFLLGIAKNTLSLFSNLALKRKTFPGKYLSGCQKQ